MENRIRSLEELSKLLNPGPQKRLELNRQIIEYSENYLNNLNTIPTFVQKEGNGGEIYNSPISNDGISLEEALGILKENVDSPGVNPASPGYVGYVPGGGLYYSALGDFLSDITNRYAGIYFLSPGAVKMENMLTSWMAGIIGYPENAGGNLTSGGSIANLTSIVTARDAFRINSSNMKKSVIYLSSQSHHSVDKAIRIAGLAECIRRYIPLDAQFRIIPEEMEKQIIADKNDGLNPFLLIASAGTTNTGTVDPITDLGEIAEKHKLWFHVDAAYGGFFVLCDSGKSILRGLSKSDSIVMDPHKGLFLPYGTGAVLIKDRTKLLNSHYFNADYMQDASDPDAELSPSDLSPEMSRNFRGLRLWLPLKLAGVKAFEYALEEKIQLARYFYEKLKEINGFELGPYPDLSIVTYRYKPAKGDINEFNKKLVSEIQKDGKVFISSTLLNGNFTLRLSVLSFRTHIEQIELLLDILKRKSESLEK